MTRSENDVDLIFFTHAPFRHSTYLLNDTHKSQASVMIIWDDNPHAIDHGHY